MAKLDPAWVTTGVSTFVPLILPGISVGALDETLVLCLTKLQGTQQSRVPGYQAFSKQVSS